MSKHPFEIWDFEGWARAKAHYHTTMAKHLGPYTTAGDAEFAETWDAIAVRISAGDHYGVYGLAQLALPDGEENQLLKAAIHNRRIQRSGQRWSETDGITYGSITIPPKPATPAEPAPTRAQATAFLKARRWTVRAETDTSEIWSATGEGAQIRVDWARGEHRTIRSLLFLIPAPIDSLLKAMAEFPTASEVKFEGGTAAQSLGFEPPEKPGVVELHIRSEPKGPGPVDVTIYPQPEVTDMLVGWTDPASGARLDVAKGDLDELVCVGVRRHDDEDHEERCIDVPGHLLLDAVTRALGVKVTTAAIEKLLRRVGETLRHHLGSDALWPAVVAEPEDLDVAARALDQLLDRVEQLVKDADVMSGKLMARGGVEPNYGENPFHVDPVGPIAETGKLPNSEGYWWVKRDSEWEAVFVDVTRDGLEVYQYGHPVGDFDCEAWGPRLPHPNDQALVNE